VEGAQGPRGVYALRCTASGKCWVGLASDLEAVEKRLLFNVKIASTAHRMLQSAARTHLRRGQSL